MIKFYSIYKSDFKIRNKILNSIPKIIQKIKNINEDKQNKQSNLFDNRDTSQADFEYLPSVPWKQKELLLEEKFRKTNT